MLLSIVVSVYNEESNLDFFYQELIKSINTITTIDYEIIFVNDGSIDRSKEILNRLYSNNNKRIKVIHFSRNYGHEAAMIAGIDYSNGDAIICMDADMQNPPEYISVMISKFEEGNEVVLMKRKEREDHSFFSKFATKMFYTFINILSPIKFEQNASDFFLISKKVKRILHQYFREKNRFLRGFIQTIGFNKTIIEYIAPARFAGESKYNYSKLLKLSFNAIASFSEKPLNLGIILGFIMGFFSIIVTIYSIIMYFVDKPISGYTTIVVLISFISSINLVVIGIIGKYIAYMYNEIKNRPIYIVDEVKSNEDV